MKTRRMLPGCQVADALGETTAAPHTNPAGSLLLVTAAAGTGREAPPNSRRLTANAVHINGPAPGTSPVDPFCSHADRPLPIPDTDPDAAAVITGATETGASGVSGATSTAALREAATRTGGTDAPPTSATSGDTATGKPAPEPAPKPFRLNGFGGSTLPEPAAGTSVER